MNKTTGGYVGQGAYVVGEEYPQSEIIAPSESPRGGYVTNGTYQIGDDYICGYPLPQKLWDYINRITSQDEEFAEYLHSIDAEDDLNMQSSPISLTPLSA